MITIRKSILSLILGLTLATGVLGLAPQAKAITIESEYTKIKDLGLIFANICPAARPDDAASDSCACRAEGKCTVDNILQVIVNLSFLILAISGTAAFIAFVYGGLEWVISVGNPERIKRGKDALSGAAIGLAIIFGAYVAINLLISVLNSGNVPTENLETTIGGTANTIITTDPSTSP
jgi:hypothetical protein